MNSMGSEEAQFQAGRDRMAFQLAEEYLLGFDQVTQEVLDSYKQPYGERPASLAGIYRRLLDSAQNRSMGPKVIGGAIGGVGNLSSILCQFEPQAVVLKYGSNWEAVFSDIKSQLSPRGKLQTGRGAYWPLFCRSITSGARFLSQFSTADDFYTWADFFDQDERARLALPMLLDHEIAGFGFALACDFVKELGYTNFGKPDVHIKRIFLALGLCTSGSDYEVFKAIVRVANRVGVTPYAADKIFWLVGSGELYLHERRIPTNRDIFIQSALARTGQPSA
jgi:hypothetical protein